MLSWIISSSILILLVMALRAVIRDRVSPRLRYALWLLVLARLLLPVNLGSTWLSVLNAVPAAETALSGSVYADAGDAASAGGAAVAVGPGLNGTAAQPAPPEQSRPDAAPRPSGGGADTRAAAPAPQPADPLPLRQLLLVAWALGAAVTAAALLSLNLQFYGNLKARGRLLGKFRGLPVYAAENMVSPCLAGLFHPAVFITPELARCEVARTHIMAHEYTHYRQKDHIWAALRCVCLTLHWYNPLVWWAAAVSRRDCELSCDAGAVRLLGEEARASYGRTLVSMVARTAAPAEMLRCATTMAGGKSAVKERVALLVKNPRTRTVSLCAVAALLLVIAGCTFTGAMAARDSGLEALEAGFAAFEAAAENGDAFVADLNHRGEVIWEAEDLYQFTDREAVLTLVERMRRCTWTYEGEYHGQDMWEQMGDMCLHFQSGMTGFAFYTGTGGTLVNCTAFAEDGSPTIRYYRAALPEELGARYDDPYDLFYETYLETCPANGGTPAEAAAAPEYGFTTMTSRESFPGEDGTELAYCDLTYPMAYVANEDALSGDALEAARQVIRTFNGEMERRMDADQAALAERIEGLEGPVAEPWYVTVSATVSVQGQLVSASMLVEDYAGGAHPNYGYDSALFDLGAGQFIDPQSLGAGPDAFTAGAAEYLIACADGFDASFHADAWGDWQETVRSWPETGSASFLEDGLHVYFDPYTLGPYALGGVELFASYEDLWGLLSESGREKLGLSRTGTPGGQADELLDQFISGSVSAVDLAGSPAFGIKELDGDAYSVGEKVDLDNDGENELVIRGPYGGFYLDARDGKVYPFAAGDGSAVTLSYTRYNGEVWLLYSNRMNAGYEAYHMERYEGADNLAAEMDFGRELADPGQGESEPIYTLNGATISAGEYAELCGEIFAAEVRTSGGDTAPEHTQVTAPEHTQATAPEHTQADRMAAYAAILELAFSGKQSAYDYYDWNITDAELLAENSFAVYDIDGDGREELIINYSGYSTASMNLRVYDYNPDTGEVRLELMEFPSTLFYNNGYVMSYASYNHGRAAMTDFWPYHLYRYAPETDTYVEIAIVDGWYREQNEVYGDQHFPADADIDGDGMVYYITRAWEYDDPIDGDAYQQWVDSWQSGATRIEIPFQSLTLENIHNIR